MVHPHHTDEREADQESELGRPLPQQLQCQGSIGRLGDLNFKNQERDGDREHTIGKSLHSPCLAVQSGTPDGMLWADRKASQTWAESVCQVAGFCGFWPKLHRRCCTELRYNSSPSSSWKVQATLQLSPLKVRWLRALPVCRDGACPV